MGFFKKFLNGATEYEADIMEDEPDEEPEEDSKLTLQSISGKVIAELGRSDQVEYRNRKNEDEVSILVRRKDGESIKLISCGIPDSVSDQNELFHMMKMVTDDIGRARRNGAETIKIPTNEYDLYAYIRNRPSIDVDLDSLEKSIGTDTKSSVLTDFNSDMHSGKRVDIYFTLSSIYNEEAVRILRDVYAKYKNIHFKEIHLKDNNYAFWNNAEIQNQIRQDPSAALIGVGIIGAKPSHCLALVNDDQSSVIHKASVLANHQMTTREQLLEAQWVDHAAGVNRVGNKRRMSRDVIRKAIIELAIDEAKYRMPQSKIDVYADAVRALPQQNAGINLLKVPFMDKTLLKNMVPEIETCIVVEVAQRELYYYGKEHAIEMLKQQYHWKDGENGEAICDVVFPERLREYELQALAISLRQEYVTEMSALLASNKNLSVAKAYGNVKELVNKYSAKSLQMEDQIALLDLVENLKNENAKTSIENIIRETLTTESPFRSFGELFHKRGR